MMQRQRHFLGDCVVRRITLKLRGPCSTIRARLMLNRGKKNHKCTEEEKPPAQADVMKHHQRKSSILLSTLLLARLATLLDLHASVIKLLARLAGNLCSSPLRQKTFTPQQTALSAARKAVCAQEQG